MTAFLQIYLLMRTALHPVVISDAGAVFFCLRNQQKKQFAAFGCVFVPKVLKFLRISGFLFIRSVFFENVYQTSGTLREPGQKRQASEQQIP